MPYMDGMGKAIWEIMLEFSSTYKYLPAAVPWSQHSKVTRPQDGSEVLFAGSRVFPKVDGKLYKKVGNHGLFLIFNDTCKWWTIQSLGIFTSSSTTFFLEVLGIWIHHQTIGGVLSINFTILDFKGSSFISRIFIIQNWGFLFFSCCQLDRIWVENRYVSTPTELETKLLQGYNGSSAQTCPYKLVYPEIVDC